MRKLIAKSDVGVAAWPYEAVEWVDKRRGKLGGKIAYRVVQALLALLVFLVFAKLFGIPDNAASRIFGLGFVIGGAFGGAFRFLLWSVLFLNVVGLGFRMFAGLPVASPSWWRTASQEWASGGAIPWWFVGAAALTWVIWVAVGRLAGKGMGIGMRKLFQSLALRGANTRIDRVRDAKEKEFRETEVSVDEVRAITGRTDAVGRTAIVHGGGARPGRRTVEHVAAEPAAGTGAPSLNKSGDLNLDALKGNVAEGDADLIESMIGGGITAPGGAPLYVPDEEPAPAPAPDAPTSSEMPDASGISFPRQLPAAQQVVQEKASLASDPIASRINRQNIASLVKGFKYYSHIDDLDSFVADHRRRLETMSDEEYEEAMRIEHGADLVALSRRLKGEIVGKGSVMSEAQAADAYMLSGEGEIIRRNDDEDEAGEAPGTDAQEPRSKSAAMAELLSSAMGQVRPAPRGDEPVDASGTAVEAPPVVSEPAPASADDEASAPVKWEFDVVDEDAEASVDAEAVLSAPTDSVVETVAAETAVAETVASDAVSEDPELLVASAEAENDGASEVTSLKATGRDGETVEFDMAVPSGEEHEMNDMQFEEWVFHSLHSIVMLDGTPSDKAARIATLEARIGHDALQVVNSRQSAEVLGDAAAQRLRHEFRMIRSEGPRSLADLFMEDLVRSNTMLEQMIENPAESYGPRFQLALNAIDDFSVRYGELASSSSVTVEMARLWNRYRENHQAAKNIGSANAQAMATRGRDVLRGGFSPLSARHRVPSLRTREVEQSLDIFRQQQPAGENGHGEHVEVSEEALAPLPDLHAAEEIHEDAGPALANDQDTNMISTSSPASTPSDLKMGDEGWESSAAPGSRQHTQEMAEHWRLYDERVAREERERQEAEERRAEEARQAEEARRAEEARQAEEARRAAEEERRGRLIQDALRSRYSGETEQVPARFMVDQIVPTVLRIADREVYLNSLRAESTAPLSMFQDKFEAQNGRAPRPEEEASLDIVRLVHRTTHEIGLQATIALGVIADVMEMPTDVGGTILQENAASDLERRYIARLMTLEKAGSASGRLLLQADALAEQQRAEQQRRSEEAAAKEQQAAEARRLREEAEAERDAAKREAEEAKVAREQAEAERQAAERSNEELSQAVASLTAALEEARRARPRTPQDVLAEFLEEKGGRVAGLESIGLFVLERDDGSRVLFANLPSEDVKRGVIEVDGESFPVQEIINRAIEWARPKLTDPKIVMVVMLTDEGDQPYFSEIRVQTMSHPISSSPADLIKDWELKG